MDKKDYIERETAMEIVKITCGYFSSAYSKIREIPAADVAPVVHAKWIICSDGYYPYCSNCKREPQGREMTKFCPNCGAKMDDDENR